MVKTKLRKISSQSLGIAISRADSEYLEVEYDSIKEGTITQNVEKKYDLIDGKRCLVIFKAEE
ncbi:hypothetical protein HNP92_000913 [Methanococcus maripaludis]|uniref:Uncharacterized protein n=1 Tax=Methanococcus maripaludis TaxID=39152 RepID=A0A7J9S9B8_METMI|nr:hypothetical protein [Methanococcus maripaludis]MBB6401608.1 hypothetical protein [Methanococcus maripaludis]